MVWTEFGGDLRWPLPVVPVPVVEEEWRGEATGGIVRFRTERAAVKFKSAYASVPACKVEADGRHVAYTVTRAGIDVAGLPARGGVVQYVCYGR